jgi:hypothetical protein
VDSGNDYWTYQTTELSNLCRELKQERTLLVLPLQKITALLAAAKLVENGSNIQSY